MKTVDYETFMDQMTKVARRIDPATVAQLFMHLNQNVTEMKYNEKTNSYTYTLDKNAVDPFTVEED